MGLTQTPQVYLLRADATAEIGVGHAMRLLALAQELLGRGARIALSGDLEIAWVRAAYEDAGIELLPAPATPQALREQAQLLGAAGVILDRYDLPASFGTILRMTGIPVMAMVDAGFGAQQDADLYVDQNPGTSPRAHDATQKAVAGAAYTMFRDDVLALRRDSHGMREKPARKVFAVFGGTDPMGAAQVLIPLLLATGHAIDIRVISTSVRAEDFSPAAGQSVEIIEPTSAWLELARESDLVITASGSSVWELLCLGVPIAVVCVADNQRPGYDLVMAENLAAPAGELNALRTDSRARQDCIASLAQAISDGALRKQRAIRGQELLDGRGRIRVADALMEITQDK